MYESMKSGAMIVADDTGMVPVFRFVDSVGLCRKNIFDSLELSVVGELFHRNRLDRFI